MESDIIKEYLNTSSNKYEKHENKNINDKTNENYETQNEIKIKDLKKQMIYLMKIRSVTLI